MDWREKCHFLSQTYWNAPIFFLLSYQLGLYVSLLGANTDKLIGHLTCLQKSRLRSDYAPQYKSPAFAGLLYL
jgi:hypothetical protein